ncbi:hypothetical protein MNBD_ALPHA05-1897, partial [hydrothermal vent metagenome]
MADGANTADDFNQGAEDKIPVSLD